MIEINGKSFSGAIVKNDDAELIVNICAVETLQDLCLILTGVKSVTETQPNIDPIVYSVTNAVQISTIAKNVYAITFTKKASEIEELSNVVDKLLVMMLEKKNV